MDLLDKLNERLTLAVEAAGESAFPGGLTVADVYQRLIPYRSVRGQLGVVELAEYEHAMLRLLSGERQYVEVVDPDVRLEVQRELASLNPILGIYRDYSGARLRLTNEPRAPLDAGHGTARRNETAASPSSESEADIAPGESLDPPAPEFEILRPLASGRSGARGASSARAQDHDFVRRRDVPRHLADRAGGERSDLPESRTEEHGCGGCGRVLPDLPEVRFCPFCGVEQGPEPCARCGAPMDRGWSFCTRCGAGRGGDGA